MKKLQQGHPLVIYKIRGGTTSTTLFHTFPQEGRPLVIYEIGGGGNDPINHSHIREG